MNQSHSYHIFLFPFRWNYYKEKDKKYNFAQRTDLNNFNSVLNKNNWSDKKYELENSENYNEYTYFYQFVRKAIFDTTDKNTENKILNHYSYKLPKDTKYLINIQKEKTYELDVENIYLHVYSTGVALLSYHLENNKYKDLDDILKINDFGKRIYPQFLSTVEGKSTTSVTKRSFLANSIEITEISNAENFETYESFETKKKINTENTFVLPKFISELLGKKFVTQFSQKNTEQIKIKPIIDDRMFTLSWYGNNKIAKELSQKKEIYEKHYLNKRETGRTLKTTEYNYLTSDDWYRYVFNDGGDSSTCQNSIMKQDLLKKHSYSRWADEETLYGVTRYSFVTLTNDRNFAKNIIQTHAKTMYYQMVVLSLMQRASVLRFAGEVTKISELENEENSLIEIELLNKEYLKFSNQMYFREVTPQEQGIELFDMIQEKMRIERDVKDLNREIDELYQYANMLEDKKERKQMNQMQKWGAIILIPTLITGIFGMNTITNNYVTFSGSLSDIDKNFATGFLVVIAFLVITAIFFWIKWIWKKFVKTNS